MVFAVRFDGKKKGGGGGQNDNMRPAKEEANTPKVPSGFGVQITPCWIMADLHRHSGVVGSIDMLRGGYYRMERD